MVGREERDMMPDEITKNARKAVGDQVPATPRPWLLDESRPPQHGIMVDQDGRRECIGVIGRGEWTGVGQEQNEADARFIVRAVNFFDELLALAKAIAGGVESAGTVAPEIREDARRVIGSLEHASLPTDD